MSCTWNYFYYASARLNKKSTTQIQKKLNLKKGTRQSSANKSRNSNKNAYARNVLKLLFLHQKLSSSFFIFKFYCFFF